MSFLSKSSLFHRILNRKYNFFVKFFFAVIMFNVCLIFSLNLQLSIFISREIIFGDDLKNDIRRKEIALKGLKRTKRSGYSHHDRLKIMLENINFTKTKNKYTRY